MVRNTSSFLCTFHSVNTVSLLCRESHLVTDSNVFVKANKDGKRYSGYNLYICVNHPRFRITNWVKTLKIPPSEILEFTSTASTLKLGNVVIKVTTLWVVAFYVILCSSFRKKKYSCELQQYLYFWQGHLQCLLSELQITNLGINY